METRKLKHIIAFIITLVFIVALFGMVFSSLTMRERNEQFWLELLFCTMLGIVMKILWYESAEEEAMFQLQNDIKTYYEYTDKEITDINDLDAFLVILNAKNKETYVKNYIGYRTPENCKKYDKVVKRAHEKADQLKPVTSMQIMTRTLRTNVIDARNYKNVKKTVFLTGGTLISTMFVVLLATIMPAEFRTSWESLFRYLSYIGSIALAVFMSNVFGLRNTRVETIDYLARLTFIVDSYVHYKRGKMNGDK